MQHKGGLEGHRSGGAWWGRHGRCCICVAIQSALDVCVCARVVLLVSVCVPWRTYIVIWVSHKESHIAIHGALDICVCARIMLLVSVCVSAVGICVCGCCWYLCV